VEAHEDRWLLPYYFNGKWSVRDLREGLAWFCVGKLLVDNILGRINGVGFLGMGSKVPEFDVEQRKGGPVVLFNRRALSQDI